MRPAVWVDLEDGDTAGCGGELVGALDEAEPGEHRNLAREGARGCLTQPSR
jgi:hypothetical protein